MSIRKLAIPVAALVMAFALADSPAQPPRGKGKGDSKAMAGLVFETYQDNGGKYRFRLKDADDNILAMSSSGHETVAEVRKTIKAIQDGAAKAKIVDAKKDEK